MTFPPRFTNLLSIGFSLLLTGAASAASIDWGLGARQITGDGDVDNTGTILAAYSFGGPGPVTVNGVTFQNVLTTVWDDFSPSVTVGTGVGAITLEGDTLWSSTDAFESSGEPYGSLSPSYRQLLNSAVWNDYLGVDHQITFTITGLTPGQTYRIQIWSNDSRIYGMSRSTTFSTYTGEYFVTLRQNTSDGSGPIPGYGGLGEYAIGTFVADGTSQTFIGTASSSTNLNAFVLSAVAVPEPGVTGAAMGVALLAFLAHRRRSRQA